MQKDKYNVIITGSTGMVGKGVLLECLKDKRIEKILLINRNNIDIKNTKIQELIINSFEEIENHIDKLSSYDACFYCLGISSVGKSEDQFSKITFNYTKILADILSNITKNFTFIYVSGTGTDSSENGKIMWANVKGKTENYILNKGFHDAYAFRPGIIIPENNIQSKTKIYNFAYIILTPFFPILKKLNSITTTSKVGKAMINLLQSSSNKKHLENIDINQIAPN